MNRPSIHIVAAPPGTTPSFEIDAIVLEDDTYSVLSADPVANESEESPRKSLQRAVDTSPHEPGSVVVKEGHPTRLLAVVHDLSHEPSWKEQWVKQALAQVLGAAEERQLASLSLPMLGTLRGTLEPIRFVELLYSGLSEHAGTYPHSIWLVLPENTDDSLISSLKAWGCDVQR